MKYDHDTHGLKHCPFCGNAAKIRKIVRSDCRCSFDDWHIYCTSCRAEMNIPADNYYGREYFTKEQAVAMWNERDGKEVEEWEGGEIGKCSKCGHEGCSSDIWDGIDENDYHCPKCGRKVKFKEDK